MTLYLRPCCELITSRMEIFMHLLKMKNQFTFHCRLLKIVAVQEIKENNIFLSPLQTAKKK